MEGTEGEDKGKREQKSVKKRGKSSGARCMVMHCSTTSQDGIPVHAMPGPMPSSRVERFSSLQMAWINFIRTKRVFDPYSCKTIIVCGLHFNESDYEPSHVRMHKMGFRKLPPRLLPNAVPHIFHAPAAATGGGSTDTAAATMTNLASGPQVTPSPQSSTLPQFSLPQSASTSDQSVEAMDTSGDEPPGPPDELDDMDTTAAPRPRPKTVKRKSSYSRKKEVAGITEEYRMKALMDRAKEILGRSKGVQCSVKMVNRKVGFRKYKRTCRVSVRPMTVSKRTLVNVAAQKFPIPQLCDASTQTEKRPAQVHHVEEAEEHGEDEEAINDDDDDDRAMKDDEKNDPSYKPGGSNEKLSPKEHTAPKLTNLAGEKKFIVFESNLLELFSTCTNCLSTNIDIKRQHSKSFGSMVKIIATCEDCNESRVWSSQPRVGNLPAGNLLLSASILFGGGSPTKILRISRNMNVQAISVNTFLEHQREFLQPAIVRVWRRQQQALFDAVGEDEKLVIGGDGRADSPGHSAKYGSYTFMDMNRNKIVHMELVQSSEVSSSNAMEKEGLKRGLEELQNHGITVGTLITDRHASVAKFIRENYQGITHKYDGWHIAKGVTKKITAVGKLKDCEAALLWKRSINNHIYWCASSTPDGDGELIAAKFLSILNHVRNVHVGHHEKFQQCAHGENYGQREWMKQGTKVFEKVSDVMTKTRLVNDIKKMSPLEQTSSVESFHSVLLYWCPKMLAYSYTGIKCRLYLAVMHWNENAHRSQATNAAGKPIFKISYPKAKEGGHTVSKVLTSCTYDYVASLMEETLQLASQKQKLRAEIPELQGKPPLCAGVDRISKDEAIEQLEAHRRFAKM